VAIGLFVAVAFYCPAQSVKTRSRKMSVAKVIEITASSKKSFEDAVQSGIRRFSKTVNHVEGAWVKEQKVVVSKGEISEYRVTMKVTFVLNEEKSKGKKKTK
jgi:hypothetical protein